jgi:hypothetical protein
MYYTEDDIRPAVKLAAEMFGMNGRMLVENGIMPNITISTREFGKIWYGDVYENTLEENCKRLSVALRKKVVVSNATTVSDYIESTPIITVG